MLARPCRLAALLAALLAAPTTCGCGGDTRRTTPRTVQATRATGRTNTEVRRQAVNCLRQAKIVVASEIARPRAEVVTEALQLAAVLRRLDRALDPKQPPPGEVRRCRAKTAELLRELATRWHREAGKTMQPITFTHARMLYEAYLATFPAAADRCSLTYYLAEVLFKLERWPEAGAAYARVVRLNPKGKHAREAAYAAVITLKNAAEQADEAVGGHVKPPSNAKRPRPIPPPQRRLLAAFETYLKLAPAAPERVPILYRRARIYYEYDHHPRAVKLLSQLVTDHPGHHLTTLAAQLLLDSLNLLRRRAELARWVDRILAEPKLAQGPLGESLTRIKLAVARKRAEQLQGDGKYEACGQRYLQLVAQQPTSRHRAELLYNAAICFDLAKLHDRAIAARKNLITSTPKAQLVPRVLLQVAHRYAAQKKEALAAHFLEWFAQRFPGEREAPDALKRAFALRLASGEHDKARANAKLFAVKYARRRRFARDAARLELALGGIFEDRGDHAGAARHYAGVLRRWGRAARGVGLLARVKLAESLWASACPVKGVHGVCAATTTRSGVQGCQSPLMPGLRLHKRRPVAVKKARAELTRTLAAVKRAKQHDDDPERRAAAARAAFLAAEPRFEAFLAITPPSLNVTGGAAAMSPRAQRALRTYLATKKQRLTEARAAYQRVINAVGPPVPAQALAALARAAQLNMAFADQLLAIPLPRVTAPGALKGPDRADFIKTWREAYCDAMDNHITPLHAAARQTLQRCTALAAKHKLDGRWARLCKQLAAALP